MLDKISFNCMNQKLQPAKSKAVTNVTCNLKENNNFKSLYIPHGVSFKGNVFALSKTTLKFAEEGIAYRSKLAQALGTTVEHLTSIISPEELKNILKTAKSENFSVGNNFENILNGNFILNLHMHTVNSDGSMTVRELLEQAAKYGDFRKNILNKSNPVIVAITDHDVIDGSKEAARIIANNPQKYKNIRVVLGIEFNTHYNHRQMEAIGYCINPFDEKLNKFIDKNIETNKNYLNNFLKNEVNQWEAAANIPPERMTTLEDVITEAKMEHTECCNNIDFWGSCGLIKGFTKGLESIFKKRNWDLDGINKFNHAHGLSYSSQAINPGTPELKDVTIIIKESGSGFIGVAHPCRNFSGVNLINIFSEFKKLGVEAAETNYQYPVNNRFPKSFQEDVDLAATQSSFLKAGGSDNHSNNIFTNFNQIENLPETVRKIILNI